MEWPSVGREGELGRFRRVLTGAAGSGVALVGAPGVGKTRLARAMLAEAEAEGHRVVWARGTRSAAAIPFGALVHLLPLPPPPVSARPQLLRWALEHLTGPPGRLVAGVDDAHLLDGASATLLHHLATGSSSVLVVTTRAGAPAPDAVVALWRDGPLERIDLRPLGRSGSDRLLEATLGGPVDPDTRLALWRLARGNPLFLRHLVEGAVERGTLAEVDGVWRLTGNLEVPDRLTEIVEHRLAELPAGRTALEILAIGDTVGLGLLERLEAPGTVEALEAHGLVTVERSGHRLSVRLVHPVYGEVLAQAMPETRRRRLAAELAEALGQTGMRREEDLLRWAAWTLEGGSAPAPELAVAAARGALGLLDHELAERLAAVVSDPEHRFDALLVLGEARSGLNRPEDAETAFLEAASVARSDDQRAQAALARARNLAWGQGRTRDAIGVLRGALDEVEGDPHALELTAELTLYVGIEGDFWETLRLAPRVLDHPAAADRAVLNTLVVATLAQTLLGRLEGFEERLRRGERLARELVEEVPLAADQLGLNRTLGRMCEGRLREAVALAEEGTATSREREHPLGVWNLTLGLLLMLGGDLRRALEVVRAGIEALREFDPFANLGMGIAFEATALAQTGRPDLAQAVLEGWDPGPGPPVPVRTQVWVGRAGAWIRATDDDPEGALVAKEAGGRAVAASHITWGAIVLHDAVRMGQPHLVVEDLSRLGEDTDCDLLGAFAAHARALAEEDPHRLVEVGRAFEQMGSFLYAAEAAAQAARVWAEAGTEHLARRWATRSAFLAERCPGAHTPALLGRPRWLTPREAEVARLASRGLASAEIGTRLGISVRTVDNHLASVYRKLGVSGREELPRALGLAHE